ncbi:NACHT domain-containing protein [Favolaschia claudopus]|uniref:NACHT domain-containing protein n=1 Tax=Favolaschia claudopus TaxID=2862362 RepID=A0AAW0DKA7_9AGAR
MSESKWRKFSGKRRGFWIHGGSFLEVAGDLNIHTPIRRRRLLLERSVGQGNAKTRSPVDTLQGGSFNIAGNVNHIQRYGEPGRHNAQILLTEIRAAVSNAFHDSVQRYPQSECHPDTRTDILQNLWRWASCPDLTRRILWLHGPAGADKSAVAQSREFFKHPSRGIGSKVFSSIAYQLALSVSELKPAISQIVEDDPSIVDRNLFDQVQQLLQYSTLSLPTRNISASRPEPHIHETFQTIIHRSMALEPSFSAVRKYLTHEFARIYREYSSTMAKIPLPWLGMDVIYAIADKSSGYFIYPSSVIRLVDDENFRPTERLKIILGLNAPTIDTDPETPFASLNVLYIQILSHIPNRARLLRVLTAVAAGRLHLVVGYIEQLFTLDAGDVRLALRALPSLLRQVVNSRSHLARNDWAFGTRVVLHDASFVQFLTNPDRAGVFYIGASRTELSCRILEMFASYDAASKSEENIACS